MKTKLTLLAISHLLSAICCTASAQGTAFTYQGRLMDGGSPANGSYDLRFAIYDSTNSPGTLIAGPLTNAPTAASNGQFTVILDFGTNVFTGADRWLEIAARTNGAAGGYTGLSPRQHITPVPYAIEAATAGGVSGVIPDAQLSANIARLNGTNVFTGPVTAPSFSGNGSSLGGVAPASGSTNYVAKTGDTMTGTLNLPANGLVAGINQLVLVNGEIGIGTALPTSQLDILQGHREVALNWPNSANLWGGLIAMSRPSDGSAASFIGGAATATNGVEDTVVYAQGGGAELRLASQDQGFGFYHVPDIDTAFGGNRPVPLMKITGAGNVGIGTANPQAELDIAEQAGTIQDGLRLYKPTNSDKNWLTFWQGIGTSGTWRLGQTVYSDGLALYVGGTDPANVGAIVQKWNINGNVGIGTTTPITRLHLSDQSIPTTLGGSGVLTIAGADVGSGMNVKKEILFKTWGNSTNAHGVIGIETVDTANYEAGDLYFATKTGNGNIPPTEKMRISNNGNIGIGTTNPLRTLQIGANDASGLSFEAFSGSPNAGALRFGDNSGWKLNFGRSREVPFGALNSGTAGVLMTIQDNGNVGVGTTTPGQKLDVNGAIRVLAGNSIVFDNSTDSGNTQLYYDGSELVSDHRVWVNSGGLIVNSGNVGIGTANPLTTLHVSSGSAAELLITSTAAGGGGWNLGTGWGGVGSTRSLYLYDYVAAATRLVVDQAGNVGIGTNSPQALLDVNGMARVKVLSITGGSDVAEPFAMSGGDIPKGAVVVIDDAHPGQLKLSQRAYDKRVAGIVSGAGGVNPGLTLSQQCLVEGGQNVALTGRVYALADAANAPIEPGDLLTTSAIPGHAMKVIDPTKAQGAIIGKSMSHLESGRGLVLVLVTLQ